MTIAELNLRAKADERRQTLDFEARLVSIPRHPLPANSCDTHAHVFGPYDRFPLAVDRGYTPPLAPFEEYLAMLDRLGFQRGVLVHAAANGFDCGVTLNALQRSAGRLRGVVVVPQTTSDEELQTMNRQGVRGIRFAEISRQDGSGKPIALLGLEHLAYFAPRLRELGWHAEIWAKCASIVDRAQWLTSLDIPLVLDHMGYFDVAGGVDGGTFQSFLSLVRNGHFWVKLTACRNSKLYPDYPDVRHYHEALLQAAPERMLYGSDWPYLRMDPHPPDAGHMLDLFDDWTGTEALRKQVLVDNPARLYDF